MKDLSWIHNHQSQFYIIKHSSSHLMPNDDIINKPVYFRQYCPLTPNISISLQIKIIWDLLA